MNLTSLVDGSRDLKVCIIQDEIDFLRFGVSDANMLSGIGLGIV